MENGKWKMENGKWKVENGKWKMENGKWMLRAHDSWAILGYFRPLLRPWAS
jgi:hypothetical protein